MELNVSFPQQPTIYCDNVGTTYLCVNPVFHSRMKHVEIDFHFVRDQVNNGNLSVSHVSSQDQLVDALTKPLSHQRLLLLRSKIGVLPGCPLLQGHDRDNFGNSNNNISRIYYSNAPNKGDSKENSSAIRIPQIKAWSMYIFFVITID